MRMIVEVELQVKLEGGRSKGASRTLIITLFPLTQSDQMMRLSQNFTAQCRIPGSLEISGISLRFCRIATRCGYSTA